MTKTQSTLLVIVGVGAVLLAAYWMVSKNQPLAPVPQQPAAIESKTDLDQAAGDLDNIDPAQLDSELNQLTTDSAF